MSEEESRTLWLIDAAYLFNAQRTISPGYTFDYIKLRSKLEQERPIWRAYYLNSTPHPPTDQQDAFHTFLRSAPPTGPKIITKLYQLKAQAVNKVYCDACGGMVTAQCTNGSTGHRLSKQVQKGVDVGLATLALTLRDDYSTLLLSSGDGDFTDVFEYLSQNGKRLELAVFRQGVATELQSRADAIQWLDDFADEIKSTHKPPPGYVGDQVQASDS